MNAFISAYGQPDHRLDGLDLAEERAEARRLVLWRLDRVAWRTVRRAVQWMAPVG